MQLENKEVLISISIPKNRELVHLANRIILAKYNLRGDEVEPEEKDFTIQSAPDWFKPEMLKALCSGLQKDYRIVSAVVHRTKFVLQVAECCEKPSINSELVLIPNVPEAKFMLALYLAKIFDCLAQIELYWGLNSMTKRNELSVLQEDIDSRLVFAQILPDKPAEATATPAFSGKNQLGKSSETVEIHKVAKLATTSKAPTKPVVSKRTEPQKTATKTLAYDSIEDIVSRLGNKGLLKNGKASTTKWGLFDCANYIFVLSALTGVGFAAIL